jgi:hypothetical protein
MDNGAHSELRDRHGGMPAQTLYELGMLVKLSASEVGHLSNGDNNSSYLKRL